MSPIICHLRDLVPQLIQSFNYNIAQEREFTIKTEEEVMELENLSMKLTFRHTFRPTNQLGSDARFELQDWYAKLCIMVNDIESH